jgi:hypothetical protein
MSRSNDTPQKKRDQPASSNPSSRASRGWVLPLVVALLVMVAWALIAVSKRAEKRNAVPESSPAVPAEPVSAPVTNAAPAAPAPVEPVTNAPPVNSAPALKLQGIVFNAKQPWAIVDGKTVYVGSRVGDCRVKEISASTLTLEDTNGYARTLFLGK